MEAFPSRFLTFLETREQRLLSWGFYDVSFTVNEISTLLQNEGGAELQAEWQQLVDEGWSMADFVDELARANILYAIDKSSSRFRTRFAETVRLTARLRQMFREDQWATGPNLVSDIKLFLKPRKYPKRDQPAAECWSHLKEVSTNAGFQRRVFEELSRNSSTGSELNYSAFQKRAFHHILSKYNASGASGSVVCAGTGAGKTKAFFIPAILGAAAELGEKPFTKIIAIYPRNVLLADQFRESLSEVMKLNSLLQEFGLRPFRLGALLGSTPRENWFVSRHSSSQKFLVEKFGGWRPQGKTGNFIIPYLKSPLDADAELVWRESDRKVGRTCLYRANGNASAPDVPDGQLSLTRESLIESPPDILFLSLEMLNRELGNPEWAKTLGLRENPLTPRLLLLDEVHSYEGIHGAQVAWVLRRWRHAIDSNSLHVVGLSATLKQAPDHLARVSAIKSSEISELRPLENEMEQESIEYNIAIKGDPASGASLLSTSIQCGMLLARTLTPRNHIPNSYDLPIEPHRFYTPKVFGFTDNLDVVNRWLSDMTDAERNCLARLRLNPKHLNPLPNPMPSDDELNRRDSLGQIWDLSRRLGFDLSNALRVGRCSSQDPGLAALDDLVIATSSLEVGFDDPQVGAIIQHKRPSSIASFIQRKGRAGRTRGSRPWTMIVLSDYGCDRFAFQQAERFFEPELDELNVPYQNQFVLRIQAAYFLLDWIGRRVGNGAPIEYMRRPGFDPRSRAAQARTIEILEDFLNQGIEWRAFRADALKLFSGNLSGPFTRLSKSQVESLFWELPRPLLLQVVPCLLRKLQRQWRYADERREEAIENRGITYPLPEFLPSATFADLDVTETRINFETNVGGVKDAEFLDVSHALTETCPGRASKRFSVTARESAFWHEQSANLVDGQNVFAARTLYPETIELGVIGGCRVFQPVAVTAKHCPPDVIESSYATWNWSNDFRPVGTGYEIPVFSIEPWKDLVTSISAFLHRDQSGVDVTRFAASFSFEIRREKGVVTIGSGELKDEDVSQQRPEAVGFHRSVDGLRVQLNPTLLAQVPELPAPLMARFRSDYYLHILKTTAAFPPDINSFLREWIWRTSLGMLTATALQNNCTLEDAQQRLEGVRLKAAERVIESIFHVGDHGLQGQESRLIESIRAIWNNADLVQAINELESLLWRNLGDEFHEWVRSRFVATLAQALRAACIATDQETGDDDLFVDVTVSGECPEIYLTEKHSGGLGIIERIVQRLCTDPNRFHYGMRHVLASCPRDRTTRYLLALVASVQGNNAIAESFARIRTVQGFSGQDAAKLQLQASLSDNGFDSTRERFVSLMSNVLRPGSSSQTDLLIHDLNNRWHDAETKLQVGIDSRVFAYSVLSDSEFSQNLSSHFLQLHGQAQPSPAQLYSATERFLMPTCPDSCQECLTSFNRYNDFGIASRELANLWLGLETPTITISSPSDDWRAEVKELIRHAGLVSIRFQFGLSAAITDQLNELFASEVEVGVLFHPISIQRIQRDANTWTVTLQLKDLIRV